MKKLRITISMAQWSVRLPAIMALLATQMGLIASQVTPPFPLLNLLMESCRGEELLLHSTLPTDGSVCCQLEANRKQDGEHPIMRSRLLYGQAFYSVGRIITTTCDSPANEA